MLGGAAEEVGHGYPHLNTIKKSIRLLRRQLSKQTIDSFARSLTAAETAMPSDTDVIIAVQRLAGTIARHFCLPTGCIIVNFREMERPGQVEISPANEYLVELDTRYRNDYTDIAAVLGHEITHVFLNRRGIGFPNELENEILTDTACTFLGVGWLSLNAHRATEDEYYIWTFKKECRLGYLTPEEFGYVLGHRWLAFREKAEGLITSSAAKLALKEGYRLACLEHPPPPLTGCGWWARLRYLRNRRYIRKVNQASGLTGTSCKFGPYQFDFSNSMRVIFECPLCSQKLRLPTEKQLETRCPSCETSFECRT